ncbi:integrase, catalytic region, zinc finger, CCHC-type containing protein [Tanacetum coccineum]
MTTLAEHIIVAGAENRPPLLENSMYDSWASLIRLFIKGTKHGRMMLDSIDNGPLVYLTIEENGQTRPKKYPELTKAQQLQDDYDVQATNIILHGLPQDVYALVNHQEVAKNIWDRCETLYEYYWRFSQLINNMYTIGMTMQQVQVNTKFLNAIPSEWSKFVTDVKFAKSLYTTNYDQLYAYHSQHERHANEVRIKRERYLDPLAFVANSPTLYNLSQSPQYSGSLMYPPPQQFTLVYAAPIHHQHHRTPINPQQHPVSPPPFISTLVTPQSQAEFPQLDSGLVVPMFQQGEDPIKCIKKAMTFLSVVASRFPPSNNQLRTSFYPRNQATIQDDGQPRVVKCYNCQGEGHMARQCTQPKRLINAAWFKEKLMLAKAQEAGQILDEEQLAFLADPDCDDLSSTKAVLMANLSSCDPEVLSEIPYSDSYPNDMINQDLQDVDIQDTNPSAPNDLLVLSLVEQMNDHEAHLDKENQTNKMVNESLTDELERYKERITIFEQRLNVDLNKREKLIDSHMDDLSRDRNAKLAAFQQEIDTLKETLSNNVKEKESLSKTLTVFKIKSKEKESNNAYANETISFFTMTLTNKLLVIKIRSILKKAQRIQPTLYDGSVIAKGHAVISVIDDEETLILEEVSRSKMLDKQNDPISIEKKIKISPIDYSKLNKIKEDFGKCFVTQKELSAEQAFWLKHLSFSETPVTSYTPVRIEAPSELSKVSLVNESLKRLKYQLANFNKVVKKRLTSDDITAGSWGFEHTKECFVTEIVPFIKVLKETFNAFDKTLLDEITDV